MNSRDRFKEKLGREALYEVDIQERVELPDDFYADGDVCGNCHEHLDEEDNYCRYCGTKRGEGEFSPYMNEFAVVEGSIKIFECRECGHMWSAGRSIVCPKCGSRRIKEGLF